MLGVILGGTVHQGQVEGDQSLCSDYFVPHPVTMDTFFCSTRRRDVLLTSPEIV